MSNNSKKYIVSLGDGWYAGMVSLRPIIAYEKSKAKKFDSYEDAELIANGIPKALGYNCKIEKL